MRTQDQTDTKRRNGSHRPQAAAPEAHTRERTPVEVTTAERESRTADVEGGFRPEPGPTWEFYPPVPPRPVLVVAGILFALTIVALALLMAAH